MTNSIDLRKHKRITVPPGLVVSHEWRAVNLSESGMLLSAPHKLTVNRTIQLQLNLDGRHFEVTAVVRHCREAVSVYDTGFFIGVEFKNHSVSEQLRLRNFVAKHAD